MTEQNGGGNTFATAESVAASTHPSSPDGFAAAAADDPFAEQPELLLGVAFLGGLLLAGLVSRLGR